GRRQRGYTRDERREGREPTMRTVLRRRRRRLVAVPVSEESVRRGGWRRRVGAVSRAIVGLAALAATAVGAGLAVQPAQAGPLDVSCSLDGGTANIGPEYAGGGATYWIPFVRTEDSIVNERGIQYDPSLHTLWE